MMRRSKRTRILVLLTALLAVGSTTLMAGCSSRRPKLRNTDPPYLQNTSRGSDIDKSIEQKVTRRLHLPD